MKSLQRLASARPTPLLRVLRVSLIARMPTMPSSLTLLSMCCTALVRPTPPGGGKGKGKGKGRGISGIFDDDTNCIVSLLLVMWYLVA